MNWVEEELRAVQSVDDVDAWLRNEPASQCEHSWHVQPRGRRVPAGEFYRQPYVSLCAKCGEQA